ncbi:hypothetical protein LIER_36029 [Lithospermum erythrorhizon]|uniref:Uncharacterized protein n=1 Tax=Lithospermum erythrorhizon TaxID=34254 RepID=A0AAV3P2E7_LITER
MIPKSFTQSPPGIIDCARACTRLIDWCPKGGCDCFVADFLVGWCYPWPDNQAKIDCKTHNDCKGIASSNATNYCTRSIGSPRGFCVSSKPINL